MEQFFAVLFTLKDKTKKKFNDIYSLARFQLLTNLHLKGLLFIL